MRRILLLLAPLLLAGCVNDSTTHYIDGNEHALTVRVVQDYFWQKEADFIVVAAHRPDCQRQYNMGRLPVDQVNIELFAAGENVFSLRAGSRLWQVETQNCNQLAAPAPGALGEPIGVFKLEGKDLVFEKAAAT